MFNAKMLRYTVGTSKAVPLVHRIVALSGEVSQFTNDSLWSTEAGRPLYGCAEGRRDELLRSHVLD
jgi:hypothetical protein